MPERLLQRMTFVVVTSTHVIKYKVLDYFREFEREKKQ